MTDFTRWLFGMSECSRHRKVLCGSFLCAIYKFSFIHSFNRKCPLSLLQHVSSGHPYSHPLFWANSKRCVGRYSCLFPRSLLSFASLSSAKPSLVVRVTVTNNLLCFTRTLLTEFHEGMRITQCVASKGFTCSCNNIIL